jgi:hypothetical protein
MKICPLIFPSYARGSGRISKVQNGDSTRMD